MDERPNGSWRQHKRARGSVVEPIGERLFVSGHVDEADEAASPEEKKAAMQTLMENKLEYSRLNKQVKDLEIKKTLLMKQR